MQPTIQVAPHAATQAAMADGLRDAVGDYVGRVEAVQADLLATYRRKRVALAAADADGLRRLEPGETAAAERLRGLIEERTRLLARAKQFGLPGGSLAELSRAVGGDRATSERIAACRRRAASLRQEGWVQWVVARRGLAHTTELLDLIARRGVRAAGYGEAAPGGALLDASA